MDTIFLGAILVVVGGILVAVKRGFNQVITALQAIHDQKDSGQGGS
jgi:archaellum component FlaF (FlaF/FlaG flagellin family)